MWSSALSPHNSLDCQELEEVSHVARAVCLTPRPGSARASLHTVVEGGDWRPGLTTRETFPDYFPVIFTVSQSDKQWPDLRQWNINYQTRLSDSAFPASYCVGLLGHFDCQDGWDLEPSLHCLYSSAL